MADFIDEMINNSAEWVFREVDDRDVESFAAGNFLSRRIGRILLIKGIKTEEDLDHYLHDDIYELYNPFLFSQMIETVLRVKKALRGNEKILIFGDRDVDGVLSTAMLYNMLKKFDAEVEYRVPEGEYGYGIDKKDIDYAKSSGISLIITVDTGISSRDEIDYAGSLEIDTIVIDHHIQPEILPNAYSILNPKVNDETYPFRDLSAGGVVLKFIHAFILSQTKNFNRVFLPIVCRGETIEGARVRNGLIEKFVTIEESIHYPIDRNHTVVRDASQKLPDYFNTWLCENKIKQLSIVNSHPYESIGDFAGHFIRLFNRKQKKSYEFVRSFIDLSALSTISDIMPLVSENRIIVREGIRKMSGSDNLGLRILVGYCDLPEKNLKAKNIAWNLSPIINSAGRMGDAAIAVKLFTTDDIQTANELSGALIEYNARRKEKGARNLSIIRPIVQEKYYKDPVIVLSTDEAEHGVTGIIASRIARKYLKPTIIIVNDGDIGIGSGRVCGNFDLVSLVSRCDDLLVKYGGHKSAVGFTIGTDKIDSFRRRVIEIVNDEMDGVVCTENIEIDDTLFPEEITYELYNELAVFEPTGTGNPPPVFSIIGTHVMNPVTIGKDRNHLKFYIPAKTGLIPVIGWGMADKGFRILEEIELIDIAFFIEENLFRGEKSLQLVLKDMRQSVCHKKDEMTAS